jgi:hypothetical protein
MRGAAVWSFDAIAAVEHERAVRLKTAPSRQSIHTSVVRRFGEALQTGGVRFGLEQSSENTLWLRAVVQFNVGDELLDWFFNAQTGYRAQFRLSWQNGLLMNERLVTDLKSLLTQPRIASLPSRLLSPSFNDLGDTAVTGDRFAHSLDPTLSKIWACAQVMDGSGSLKSVPLGLTTPRLVLPDGQRWLAISQDEVDAWLEVKGAFMKPTGLYQPKSPEVRAKAISSTGEPGVK